METPNIQKLIVVFLILAALASSSVFLLSNGMLGAASPAAQRQAVNTYTDPLTGKTAFVENVPTLADFSAPRYSDQIPSATDNLTERYADQLAKGVVGANPQGPTQGKDGVSNFVMPTDFTKKDMASLVGPVSKETFAPVIENKRIKIQDNFQASDVLRYLSDAQTILSDMSVASDNILSAKNPDSGLFANMNSIYASAENRIYGLRVPTALAPFNRSVLGLIESQKSLFNTDDPVKSLIVFKNADLILAPAKQAVDNEVANLRTNLPKMLGAGKDENGAIAKTINSLLGIQKAYALVDIIGGPSGIINAILKGISTAYDAVVKFLQQYKAYVEIAVEILKNTLLKNTTNSVVRWLVGNGDPQFVNNWKGFLGNAFGSAANLLIGQYSNDLCSNFGSQIKIALTVPVVSGGAYQTYAPGQSPYACTLDKVVGNIADFQNNFANGGWLAYGTALSPQNTFGGSFIELHDQALAAGNAAQTAAQSEAVSGGGYKSQKECVSKDEKGNCTQYNNTTPGQVINSTANQAIGNTPFQRIIGAKDLTSLAVYVAEMAINSLLDSDKGLTNSVENVGQARNCSAITDPAQKANCEAQQAQLASATGGQIDASAQVYLELKNLSDQYKKLAGPSGSIQTVLRKGGQTLNYLAAASSTCQSYIATCLSSSSTPSVNCPDQNDAFDTLSFIDGNTDKVQNEIANDQNLSDQIANAKLTIGDTEYTGKMQQLAVIMADVKAGKVQELSDALSIPLLIGNDATTTAQDFYGKMSIAINNPGSRFAVLFGSISDVGTKAGNIDQFVATLSVEGTCGILEKAQLLPQLLPTDDNNINNRRMCSLNMTNRVCRKGNY